MISSYSSSLFPSGHKKYDLKITPPENGKTYSKEFECPFCLNHFEKDVLRQSAMRLTKTDPDLRSYYTGIEPLYFEIVTCPSCYFSAVASVFLKANASREKELFEILAPYRGEFDFSGKDILDIDTMFAGFYLAALCAPISFPGSDMIAARVWHRLSWLYGDCGDDPMSETAGKKALDGYINVFQNSETLDEQTIRVQLIIAELSFRTGDLKTASEFFIKVRMNKQASPVYQRLADDRISDIRQK